MKYIDPNITFVQEPVYKVIVRKLNGIDILRNLFFSNIFQLLPIWVMLLIQFVTEYFFGIEEYIGNLLIFAIVACATNLSDLFRKSGSKMKELSTIFAIFILIFVLCFSSILYCLLLLYNLADLRIKIPLLMYFALLFTLIVVLINIWQAARKGN